MTQLKDIVTLLPCGGMRNTNIPANHVYLLYDENGSVQEYTLGEAKNKFGESGFRLSSSHSLCPNCYKAVSEGKKYLKLGYSGELLRQNIAENIGAVRVLVGMAKRGHGCDFESLRQASAQFNAGLVELVSRLSQGQIVESNNVGKEELTSLLALSKNLDWQDPSDLAWKEVYSLYNKITGEALEK